MKHDVRFTLSYAGRDSEYHQIDFYDVAQALLGFQRSLALTTHLIVNGEVITQSPFMKGAKIYALPARDGSWQLTVGIIGTLVYTWGSVPKETPLGHLIYSAYDYVISESLGFHVDYDKSLGQLYDEAKKNPHFPTVKQHQLDSLIEKCSTAVGEMHRPIYKTKTATSARIITSLNSRSVPVGPQFSIETYEYMREVFMEEEVETIKGRISSYNSNTFKGRIYVSEEGRPVPFELAESCRGATSIRLIVNSLSKSALKAFESEGSTIYYRVFKNKSKSGYLKAYKIIEVLNHS